MEDKSTENSSQEVKTYSDEQFKGLLADKQAEVKKRQDAEKQIADLQTQVETLTSRSSRANEETSEQDKPLTIGQFQKLMSFDSYLAEKQFSPLTFSKLLRIGWIVSNRLDHHIVY